MSIFSPEKINGLLVHLLRQFAAARIGKTVVAVFDNDAGAQDALSVLQAGQQLPPHYAAMLLPDLPSARSYPTVGPTGSNYADVNGRAAALELYFPTEVLLGEDGALVPIRWTGRVDKLDKYQGELVDKSGVQRRMDKLLEGIKGGVRHVDTVDFDGMRSVLDAIFERASKLSEKRASKYLVF